MNKDWIIFFAFVAFIIFLVVAVYIIIAYPPPIQYNPSPFQPPFPPGWRA